MGGDDVELPPGILMVLLNPKTKAMIFVGMFPSEQKTPQVACEELMEQVTAQKGKATKIKAAPDGSSASFTFSRKDEKRTKGKIMARVLPEKTELSMILMGMWPGKADKPMTADFDKFGASVKIAE